MKIGSFDVIASVSALKLLIALDAFSLLSCYHFYCCALRWTAARYRLRQKFFLQVRLFHVAEAST